MPRHLKPEAPGPPCPSPRIPPLAQERERRQHHPQPMTVEMCDAYCQAVLHDPHRAGHIADALRGIMKTPAGEPMETEAVALLLWDLAAQVTAADHKKQQEHMNPQFNTYRRDLPGYQEPRA